MSVSIVINNYNYARFLGEAIRSALEQSVPALEVIVVDDGSTDHSREVIESFGDRIVAIFQNNGGQAAAFNSGIMAAKGEWVWLLDADDSLKADALETAISLLEPGISRIAMGMELIDKEGNSLCKQVPNNGRSFKGTLRDALLKEGELPSTPTSGNIFLRDALLAALPVPEEKYRICADAYLFVMCGRHGMVKQNPAIVANYRIHGANHYFSQNRDPLDASSVTKQLDNALRAMELLEDYGSTLTYHDSRRIMRFWLADQLLPLILRAKLAGVSHENLFSWNWLRIMLAYSTSIFSSSQTSRIKLRKLRQSLKLLLIHLGRTRKTA
jgi:glycosyltransferase involved in cell wall biosynthesis